MGVEGVTFSTLKSADEITLTDTANTFSVKSWAYYVADTANTLLSKKAVFTGQTYSQNITLTLSANFAPTSVDVKVYSKLSGYGGHGHTVYSKVYKNGIAVGVEQSTSLNTPSGVDQTETINVSAGDTIELWGKGPTSAFDEYELTLSLLGHQKSIIDTLSIA